jgi:hypothetical protein
MLELDGDPDGDTEPFSLQPCPHCAAVTAVPVSLLPWTHCEVCKAPYGAFAPVSSPPDLDPSPDATMPNQALDAPHPAAARTRG